MTPALVYFLFGQTITTVGGGMAISSDWVMTGLVAVVGFLLVKTMNYVLALLKKHSEDIQVLREFTVRQDKINEQLIQQHSQHTERTAEKILDLMFAKLKAAQGTRQ